MSKTTTRKIRPLVKRHGGKAYLAKQIVALMPPHRVYFEPFVGGGSVLLNKPPSEVEIANDLDAGLVNLWRCLEDPLQAVVHLAGELPYDEATFDTAAKWLDSESDRVRAIGYLVRYRFSRGGLGKSFAWSERLRSGKPGDVNAWETFVRDQLPAIAERVRNVRFFNQDAVEMLGDRHSPNTLIYADPPYLHETRTARNAYEHEMSRERHIKMLESLCVTQAKVMLSGYRSDLYDFHLAGWNRVEFDMPNHSGQGKSKQRRIECLWMNYDPAPGERL